MAIPKPGAGELALLAESIHGRAPDEPAAYARLISEILDVHDALELIPEASPPVRREPSSGYRFPSREEDPFNAWYLRTSISGPSSGPLRGRRIAVKDCIMVAGVPMTNGSDLLEGYVPDVDATVVTRVLDAGGEIVGKTQCEYLCLSGGSHTSAHGPTHNPHRVGWSAGGSSSGSAVAVVTGDADMALGTDQAGSVRIPASFSGLVGLKPTFGLVPFTGVAPVEPLIDHVGPMAATVEDNALLLQCIAGPDGYDSRQTNAPATDYRVLMNEGVAGLRVAVVREGFGQDGAEADVEELVRTAADTLAKLGATVDEVSIPLHRLGAVLWLPITIAGLTETVLRGQGFGSGRDDHYPTTMMEHLWTSRDRSSLPPNVKLLTLAGAYLDRLRGRTLYGKAVNRVRTLRAAYDRILRDYDVLLMPSTPQKAPRLLLPDAGVAEWCAQAMNMAANTCPFNVTHHPAISVPCGVSEGLPVGLMLIAGHYDEQTLYRVAHAYERA